MTGDASLLRQEIARITGLPEEVAAEGPVFKEKLIALINELIANDFERLIGLLYRLDISEKKLKQALAENSGTDAALLIADAIIQRQAEKIKTRAELRRQNDNIPEDEKW